MVHLLVSDMIHQFPLLTERQYIATIHSRLQDSQPWKLPGLQGTVRLAWALALRGISQLPDVTGKLIVVSGYVFGCYLVFLLWDFLLCSGIAPCGLGDHLGCWGSNWASCVQGSTLLIMLSLRPYFEIFVQGSLLVRLKGLYAVSRIEPR